MLAPSAVDPRRLDELLARDPVANVFVSAHVRRIRAARGRTVPPVLGIADAGHLAGACWVGSNVVPVHLDEAGQDLVAAHLLRGGHRYASFFGPAEPVLGLWRRVRERWPSPFDVRPDQPLLQLARDPDPAALRDPAHAVRWARPDEYERVLRASAAMFEEEVGYSPFADGGNSYRQRVRSLVRQRHTVVLTDPSGAVVYKADIGSLAGDVCQIQGVWVRPASRGRGLAVPCVAATVRLARTLAPVVSLYVNSFNHPAVATYDRVGFRRVGTFATVLW